jgi:hypothetical protein
MRYGFNLFSICLNDFQVRSSASRVRRSVQAQRQVQDRARPPRGHPLRRSHHVAADSDGVRNRSGGPSQTPSNSSSGKHTLSCTSM